MDKEVRIMGKWGKDREVDLIRRIDEKYSKDGRVYRIRREWDIEV